MSEYIKKFKIDKYASFNREERFWCFLLSHTLLTKSNARTKILEFLEDEKIKLNTKNLEVYIETAILRDYWHYLKKLDEKNKTTEFKDMKRYIFLKDILSNKDHLNDVVIDIDEIEKEENEFFKTVKGNIVNPSRWTEKKILCISDQDKQKKLFYIKWAFNAKPDIMLMDEKSFVFIEAKLESKEDKYKIKNTDIEATQTKIQGIIADIISKYIFKNKNYKLILLSKDSGDLNWEQVKKEIMKSSSGIDNFTKKSFENTPYI